MPQYEDVYEPPILDATAQAIANAILGLNPPIPSFISDAFSVERSYSVGDIVIYENKVYVFTSDKSAGAWDSTKVTETTIGAICSATNASLTYKSLASGSFKNTGTDYEYTGISFTIPQGKIAIVKVTTIWASGKPKGLAITSTTANINTPIAANDTSNASLAAISLTALLTAGTYYVWNKRETIPNGVNDYTVGGIIL